MFSVAMSTIYNVFRNEQNASDCPLGEKQAGFLPMKMLNEFKSTLFAYCNKYVDFSYFIST
jgi:hypothetical protein